MTKKYNRPVPTALAVVFFVFKKPRTAQEIADLMDISIDQVRRALVAAEEEGLVKRARQPRTPGSGFMPYHWKRAI